MGTIQIDGSTPKLTIGNATAEDATILFDGNAQDFYIALDDSADDLLIGLGSTVGTTPAISIDENLAIKTYGDITMTGTTPTLTIGDAGAEDTAIVFDGNAQDFYIGLDDSADDLVVGLGSSVGTTPAISINSDRDVTISDGAIDFDVASHDTSNGLKLGGTLVTATAAELNIMDGVTATAAEINLIDGGTARGTTAIADGDGVLINDAGTMRQTTVETLKTYIGGFDVSSITGATALAIQPAATDEIVLSDAGTLKRLDIKHIQNTPAFHGYNTTTTAISSNCWCKVPIDTEVFDSDGTFDHSTNYRFTPTIIGYYLLWGEVKIPGIDDNEGLQIMIKKNGAHMGGQVMSWSTGTNNEVAGCTINVAYLDADDYVELFAYQNSGDSQNYDGVETGTTGNTHFGGMRISGV